MTDVVYTKNRKTTCSHAGSLFYVFVILCPFYLSMSMQKYEIKVDVVSLSALNHT